MTSPTESLSTYLARGPRSARQLIEYSGVSQPTVSRILNKLGREIVRIGAARSIQYALRDRRLPDIPVYRVDAEGKVRTLGLLIPVRPEGFVLRQEEGITQHSDGMPWWLFDMRPQGYLGRRYAARHGAMLGLPEQLTDWTDTHALRALLAHGQDVIGDLLLGDLTRERFLTAPLPTPIPAQAKAEAYVQLANEAIQGDRPGSSAGGEQPKFTTFADTPEGPRHVIVKFSEPEKSPVSERWCDLLLAEHLALSTLNAAYVPAAQTQLIEHEGQRFLEVSRFDRIGPQGRRGIVSLTALDAEFVGAGAGGWPLITQRLAAEKQIHPESASRAALLWAFGTLIGNTDMHNGNLSFVFEQGHPNRLASAYDMTPMAFAPRSGGGLPDTLPEAVIQASVANDIWRQAEKLAQAFLARIQSESRFSQRWEPCIAALARHLQRAHKKIERLG